MRDSGKMRDKEENDEKDGKMRETETDERVGKMNERQTVGKMNERDRQCEK